MVSPVNRRAGVVTPQKVQVFALGQPTKGTPKGKRRYYVRWRIDGRDRMRSFKTKAEAEHLRSLLQQAVREHSRFDVDGGLPVEWMSTGNTWWTWSREWLALKWPGWSGNSRRTGVESLVAIAPHMVRSRAPQPPDEIAPWLREVGFDLREEIDDNHVVAKWLDRYSLPLDQIAAADIERALTRATTKRDGSAASVEVVRRRRTALNAVLKLAVKRGHMDSNPMEQVEWKVPERSIAVDIMTVPSFSDIKSIVDFTLAGTTAAARYGTLFACVGFAGLRPSEVMGLRAGDLTLPESEEWGTAVLRGATTAPGTRFSDGPGVHEEKQLKQRAVGAVRPVPLPPVLVGYLQSHLVRFPPVEGRVFTTSTGNPLTGTSYTQAWKRARANQWPDDPTFAKVTLYDLRHSAATLMLRSGVVPAEVARRLGHSVDVLMRTYAGVLGDELDRSNALIEAELERQLRTPDQLAS